MKYIILNLLVWLSVTLSVSAQTATEMIPEDSVYTYVENMPEFPGGQAAMMHYISKNLRVGEIDWDENVLYNEAFVSRFIVTKNGNIENIEVIRTTHIPKLDSIYCDLIQKMPIWKPGTQHGKNVNVYYSLPIRSRLQR